MSDLRCIYCDDPDPGFENGTVCRDCYHGLQVNDLASDPKRLSYLTSSREWVFDSQQEKEETQDQVIQARSFLTDSGHWNFRCWPYLKWDRSADE